MNLSGLLQAEGCRLLRFSGLGAQTRKYESFRKFGVPYFGGALYSGSYYLGYYIRVPYFRKLPYE